MEDRRKLLNDFLEAFPLETLPEMPLEKYTNLNRSDSFCYWVERRTQELGSVSNGPAYKFGIYRKSNEKPGGKASNRMSDGIYAWYAKYGNTAQEAYAQVRNGIVKIANHARNGEFEAVDSITTLGEVVKWKIAFLYSSEQLIPIYSRGWLETVSAQLGMDNPRGKSIPAMQRFLFEKKGAEDLFVFYDRLLQIYADNAQAGKPAPADRKYWLYAPGERASKWDLCQQDNIICIGWDGLGDLGQYDTIDSMKDRLREVYEQPDASFMNDGLAVWEFVHAVKPGDVVYAKSGIDKIVGRGIVTSDYIYDGSYDDFRSIHRVEWTHIGVWDAPHKSVLKTLTDITKYPGYVKAMEALFLPSAQKRYWWLVANPGIWSMAGWEVGSTETYSLYGDNGKQRHIYQNFLDAKAGDAVIGYESGPVMQIVALAEVSREQDGETIEFVKTEALERPIDYSAVKAVGELKNMQYFANPMGSFFSLTKAEYEKILEMVRASNAAPAARPKERYTKDDFLDEVYMTAEAYDSLTGLLRQKKNIILQGAPGVGKTFTARRLAYAMLGQKEEEQIEMVQFHQNFSYEDFIMGYRPTANGGFALKTGIFYDFCQKAQSHPDRPYFFIIDEINRGNLSKIFGELLMLIENGYRGKHIKLAYKDEDFTVPENIYIIGMMNTADRSLALIDYALRRRFSFFEMEPGFTTDGFRRYQESLHDETFDQVVAAVVSLNEVIAQDDSLGPGFCIGHSYFCSQQTVTREWLRNVVNYDIAPMLKEYWFDDPQKSKMHIDLIKNLLS